MTARYTIHNTPKVFGKLGIFVLSFNGFGLLEKCIPSVLSEGHVIIVDNGSTDETAEKARRWPEVTIVRLATNVPLGEALNCAVRILPFEHLALLNNDVIAQPDSVRRLSALLDERPSVGMALPELLNADGTRQHFGMGLDLGGFPVNMPPRERPVGEVLYQSGCVAVMRRDDFLNIGGYSEYLEWYAEDLDLAWKVRGIHKRVVVDERAKCVHLGGATLGSSDLSDLVRFRRRLYYRERNIILVFVRNAPWWQLLLHLPLVIALQIAEALAAGIFGDRATAGTYIKSWTRAFSLVSRVLDARHREPTARTGTVQFTAFRWTKLRLALANRASLRRGSSPERIL